MIEAKQAGEDQEYNVFDSEKLLCTVATTINGHTHQCPKCIEIFLCLNPSCAVPGGVGADKRCHCADVERYAELRRLVEDWQNPFPGNPSPHSKTESEATQALLDWSHR